MTFLIKTFLWEIHSKLLSLVEGRPYPWCYDFKWSVITARGDWRSMPLLLWFQMKWNNSSWRPKTNVLLWFQIKWNNSIYIYIYILYFHCKGCSLISPCYYFTSFEIITPRAVVFIIRLLLFHIIWNHNCRGNDLRSPIAIISLHLKS